MRRDRFMIDFDYTALAALAAVAREGTFEAAARSLNVTQSAVSQRIKLLEERLGAIVIVRGRPCVPTEFGLQLCRHVDHVLMLEHDLKRQINEGESAVMVKAAVLRIVVNSDSLSTWFPAVVLRAKQELNVHLEVLTEDQEYSADHLKSGEAMAALTGNETPIQGFQQTHLGAMEYLAVASPRFCKEYFPDGVTINALRAAPSIVFDRKDQLPRQWTTLAFGEIHPLHGSLIPSYEGYLACLLNGSGWGMMPAESVETMMDSGHLIELVPEKRVSLSLYWHSSVQETEVMRMLADIVSEEASERLVMAT